MRLVEVSNKQRRSRNQLWKLTSDVNSGRANSISLYGKKLDTLFGAPEIVQGDFICNRNSLKSLKHAPRKVGGDFLCRANQLSSLNYAPEYVGQSVVCNYNYITSLSNIHKIIKYIGDGFYFGNQLDATNKNCLGDMVPTNILGVCLIQGLQEIGSGINEIDDLFLKYKSDVNLFQEALIDAGYDAQARL